VSALSHSEHDEHPGRPPLSADVLAWRKRYEDMIADGSFRFMPSVEEQFDTVRKDFGLTKS
jgi:hypothetical protein